MDKPLRPWDPVTLIHVWDEDGAKRTYGPFWDWIPHRSDPLIAGRRVELEAVMQTKIPDDVIRTENSAVVDVAKATEYQDWVVSERQRLEITKAKGRRREILREIPVLLGYLLYGLFTLWCLVWAVSMWMLAIIPIGIWLAVTIGLMRISPHHRR